MVGLGIAACGGDLDPGAGDDPGSGTRTLAIQGSAHASARVINARGNADFDTEFTVRVSLNNQTVTTGTITVTSSTGKVPLTLRADNHWSGKAAVYNEVYILDVVSGPDRVESVRVDGPDIHVFSQPTPGATVDTTLPLMIMWSRDDEADSAELRTETLTSIVIADSGAYSLAAGVIRPDKDQALQHMLRLSRTNRVVPAGTTAGSTWSVTIENAINVRTEPQPLPL